jgi:hypothetical protein
MTTEFEHVVMETSKAKKSVIGNSIGFTVGVLITALTLFSPSPIFLLAWGAIIFCPIAAARSYRRYKNLRAMLGP